MNEVKLLLLTKMVIYATEQSGLKKNMNVKNQAFMQIRQKRGIQQLQKLCMITLLKNSNIYTYIHLI